MLLRPSHQTNHFIYILSCDQDPSQTTHPAFPTPCYSLVLWTHWQQMCQSVEGPPLWTCKLPSPWSLLLSIPLRMTQRMSILVSFLLKSLPFSLSPLVPDSSFPLGSCVFCLCRIFFFTGFELGLLSPHSMPSAPHKTEIRASSLGCSFCQFFIPVALSLPFPFQFCFHFNPSLPSFSWQMSRPKLHTFLSLFSLLSIELPKCLLQGSMLYCSLLQ